MPMDKGKGRKKMAYNHGGMDGGKEAYPKTAPHPPAKGKGKMGKAPMAGYPMGYGSKHSLAKYGPK